MMIASEVKFVAPVELKKNLDNGVPCQVIDIREEEELLECNLDFTDHVPMADVVKSPHIVKKDMPVVFVCGSGLRATALVLTLVRKHQLNNLTVLEGGVTGWIEKVDSSLKTD